MQTCELFPYFATTPMVAFWKGKYCEAEHATCARFQTANEGKVVPLGLLPNGKLIRSRALGNHS
jgi:hypothetical protein